MYKGTMFISPISPHLGNEMIPRCACCGGGVEDGGELFDVVKAVNSGGERRVERFICRHCAEREAKREAAVARERKVQAAITMAMRGEAP